MFRLRKLSLSVLPIRLLFVVAGLLLFGISVASAAIPGTRRGPEGTTAPNPGTQQQELGNITFPFPFNVFEFPVTCGACHGGTIDQQVGHYGNWAGSNMASAARDPIFRANAMIVNDTVRSLTGTDGAANLCFRCHSPNGWLSGRFDPKLAGNPDGSGMIHSILASTDDEGVMCETCHRAMGGVEAQAINGLQPGVNGVTTDTVALQTLSQTLSTDPAFNMMAGLTDWPHKGVAYPNGPLPGNPLGDATLQFNDGMTYGGKYDGSVDVYFSDVPILDSTGRVTAYTGQTYGIYPPNYTGAKNPVPTGMPQFNAVGQEIVYNPDGSVSVHFEVPKANPSAEQSLSIEHPTYKNEFIRSSEFCGACHDLTVPVLNHGMPEQRTFTEWKYSQYGVYAPTNATTGEPEPQNCQSCHAGSLKHEYADDAAVSLNADPTIVGWAPYAKDRNATGGTTVHKLAGANRDLPAMMQILYPEVDLEVIGAPTGRDTRLFPGVMSDRSESYARTIRNTEIQMRNALNVELVKSPTYNATTGKWEVQVKVTNTSGHRIPTGYPDGRRFWLSLNVTDASGKAVYQSGVYNEATAELSTDGTKPFTQALSNTIDSGNNAVMVYDKVTATCAGANNTNCTISPSLLNGTVVLDNRIPPAGYNREDYYAAGTRFYSYSTNPDGTVNQVDTKDRYADGQNYDLVTYTFDAPADAALNARAEVYWQTHTKPFMEHLRTSDSSTVRPEGPPSIYAANYPLTPTYLSDTVVNYVNTQTKLPKITRFGDLTALDGTALNDNWGGVAYAAWLLSGKGTPFLVDAADTTQTTAPAEPILTATAFDPYAIDLKWNQVAGADGYYVWIRYGLDSSAGDVGVTASWDRLAVVYPNGATGDLTFRNDGLNVGKSYQYRIEAFNGAGSTTSKVALAKTPSDLPLPPADPVRVIGVTTSTVTLAWVDQADNETHFAIQRQTVQPNGNLGPFVEVGMIASQTTGLTGFGGNNYTDTGLTPNTTYNYQIVARNATGDSTPTLPVAAKTLQLIPPPTGSFNLALQPSAQTSPVNLFWYGTLTGQTSFLIKRADGVGVDFNLIGTTTNTIYTDNTTLTPGVTYTYQVVAINDGGQLVAANTVTVVLPAAPAAPTGLQATRTATGIALTWTTPNGITVGANNSYTVEQSVDNGVTWSTLATVAGTATSAPATTFSDATATATNTLYSYRVSASNTAGTSPASTVATALTVPGVPTVTPNLQTGAQAILTLNTTGNGTVTYTIQRRIGNAGQWTTLTTTATGPTYTDNTLVVGTTYNYQVSATNASGTGPFGTATVTTPRLPGVPRSLSNSAGPLVTLNWLPPTGTVPVTGYAIERSTANNATGWAAATIIAVPATPTTYTDNSVVAGMTYYYRVRAVNQAGSGAVSNTRTVGVLLAPTTVRGTRGAVNSKKITVAWAYTNNNQTGFALERSVNGGAWTPITVAAANLRTYTDSGLTVGATYTYRIRAVYTHPTNGTTLYSPYSATSAGVVAR